jgi:hypothetical protein
MYGSGEEMGEWRKGVRVKETAKTKGTGTLAQSFPSLELPNL